MRNPVPYSRLTLKARVSSISVLHSGQDRRHLLAAQEHRLEQRPESIRPWVQRAMCLRTVVASVGLIRLGIARRAGLAAQQHVRNRLHRPLATWV